MAQCYEEQKAQDTMVNKEIMNWTPDALYFGYGPTSHPSNGNQGPKPQCGSNLKHCSTYNHFAKELVDTQILSELGKFVHSCFKVRSKFIENEENMT